MKTKELINDLQELKLMISDVNKAIYNINNCNIGELHNTIKDLVDFTKRDMQEKVDEIIEQIKGEQE